MACSQTQLFKNSAIGCSFHRSETTERRVFTDGELFRYSVGVFLAIAKNPTVIILGFHPRDSGSSPDSGIFFCFLRPRACVRAPARVWGPWGLCARAARVWGLWGVVCLWGFGVGWGARGACGGLVTRWRVVGLIFFCPKKVRPASYPRVPRATGEITRAPRREGQPRRRVARVLLGHLAFTPRARRRSRMRSMVTTAVSQTAEEEARVLEKDYHTPPRPNASSRSSRNVPELCTYEPPSTTWTPPLAFSSATFVASS